MIKTVKIKAKGDALTVSMKIEDELYNYITKNQ